MATCHSLRTVDDELVGDPLDLKMFEFTGWSFEESVQKTGGGYDEVEVKMAPSVARPPPGMEYDIDESGATISVSPRVEIPLNPTDQVGRQFRSNSVS